MASTRERVLVVESDPEISDLISRQSLKPLGYQVIVVDGSSAALQIAVQTPPDLLIANLNLAGLKATDLLVALHSQGVDVPLLVISERGHEADILQAFRAGAVDYLHWPARDAEIVSTVERALRQTRDARASKQLDEKLKKVNEELQRKVSELTTILSLGKAVTSITDQRTLFARIVESAVKIAGADTGWLMLRDEASKVFLLSSHLNLPGGWAKKINQPLDDGISSLVMLSGETLLIHGKALEKFKVSVLGKSAAVVPIKVQSEVIGVLIAIRKAENAFSQAEQSLLEAVSDFASISLVNARLFRALEKTAESARRSEQQRFSVLTSVRSAVGAEVRTASYPVELMLSEKYGPLSEEQRQALETVQQSLKKLTRTTEQTIPHAAPVEK